MQSNSTLTIDFMGSIKADGVPANIEGGNRHLDTVGGIISNDNTQLAYFGRVVSVDPAADNDFIIGWRAGLVPVGPIVNNQGIRENEPAKPTYILNGMPATVCVEGPLWFANWKKDALLGLIDPAVGVIVLFSETTGQIAFVADGTAVYPAGYKPLLATVLKADEPNGCCIKFLPSFPVLTTDDDT